MYKHKQGMESIRKPSSLLEEKKFPKKESSSGKLKVINVIQDVSPIASRKWLREGHMDPLVITMPIDQCMIK